MIRLTPQKIAEIHDLLISNYGGASGILCQGTVDYLILGSEGWFIQGDKDMIIRALLKIARYECEVEDIEKWLRGNAGRL